MSELFDRFRSTAGKAAFEAEKIRKINTLQSNIKSLKEDMEKSFFSAGRLVFFIYQQGEVTQPALVTACEKLRQLQEEVSSIEQEIENIRQEEYVPAPPSSGSSGKICPNGHGSLPPSTKFCQTCGAQGVEEHPAAASSACDNCGTPLQEGAKFCAGCGQPVNKKKEVEQQVNKCKNCGAELPDGAQFCVACGTSLLDPSPSSLDSQTEAAESATFAEDSFDFESEEIPIHKLPEDEDRSEYNNYFEDSEA